MAKGGATGALLAYKNAIDRRAREQRRREGLISHWPSMSVNVGVPSATPRGRVGKRLQARGNGNEHGGATQQRAS
jgi:hypothetical protein